MAGVRDPAFWRRFSMAVHLDEEKAQSLRTASSATSSPSSSPIKPKGEQIQHTDTWLDRSRQKQRKAFMCGWVIAVVTLLLVLGVVGVMLWVFRVPPFDKMARR